MKGGYNFGAITTYVSIPTDVSISVSEQLKVNFRFCAIFSGFLIWIFRGLQDMGGYAVCLAIFKSTSINIIGRECSHLSI